MILLVVFCRFRFLRSLQFVNNNKSIVHFAETCTHVVVVRYRNYVLRVAVKFQTCTKEKKALGACIAARLAFSNIRSARRDFEFEKGPFVKSRFGFDWDLWRPKTPPIQDFEFENK